MSTLMVQNIQELTIQTDELQNLAILLGGQTLKIYQIPAIIPLKKGIPNAKKTD